MTTKNNKAIILLNIPKSSNNHQLSKDIIGTCKNHNLSVIKIIQSKGNKDCYALHQLIRKICSWHTKPITVIIDKNFSRLAINTLTCSVLGTLVETGLIKVCTFESNCFLEPNDKKINFHFLTREEDNLLYIATNYFKQINLLNNLEL